MNRIQVTFLIALLGFAGGCSSTLQAKHVEPSGFLADYRPMLQTNQKEGSLQDYKNPRANLATYDKIILKPVVVWERFSSTLNNEQRDELQALADAFYDTLYLKLSKDYSLVEKPAAGAMVIQVAITHAEKSWIAPALLSKTIWQLQILNAVYTYFSGKPAFAGEITVEFTVHDSQTKELLIAGADRRVGGQNLLDRELFNSWGDAKNSLEFWSDQSAYRFCVLRSGAGCIQPEA